MGKVKTGNSSYPTPIELYLLEQEIPSSDDIETLKYIAALREDLPAPPMLSVHYHSALIGLYESSNESLKKESIHFARNTLANAILDTDSPKFLNNMALFLLKLLHAQPQHCHANIIADFSPDAILRLAMINQEIAIGAFSLLLESLHINEKKWLYLTLHLEQIMQRYQFNHENLDGPAFECSTTSTLGRLVLLYLHWPTLREKFKSTFNAAEDSDLIEAELKHQQLIRHQLTENLVPFVTQHSPIRTPNSLEIQRDLMSYSSEMIAWVYINTLLLKPVDFNGVTASAENQRHVEQLLRKHARNELLLGLKQRCPPNFFAQAQAIVERELDNHIKSLTFDARRWLFLILMLEDEKNISSAYPKPTGHDLQVCHELQALATNSPYVIRLLHQRLVSRLGADEPEQLFSYISRFIHLSTDNLPNQMRLWQYLALETSSQPFHFSSTSHSIHESFNSPVISRTVLSPLSSLLQNMTQYSSFVRHMIYHALLNNDMPDLSFDNQVGHLHIFQNHYASTQLKSCNENTLCWLYFSLTINMQVNEIKLSADKCITKPQDQQWLQAKLILQTIFSNPEMMQCYLKEIQRCLPYDKLMKMQQIEREFLQGKLNRISLETRKWLYWALKTRTYQQAFEVKNECKDDLAKILYMLCAQPSFIPFVLEYLLLHNDELSHHHPEIDELGEFALAQNPDGALCYQQSLSEDASHRLLPLFMKSHSKITKGWLLEALTTGKVNSQEFLQALLGHSLENINKEMLKVTQLLILAIKWPSVRARLITECGGEGSTVQPFSSLVLDELPLGDKGMKALILGLGNQREHLTTFSAINTGISDDGVDVLAENLIGYAPLKILLLHKNPKVSAQSLQSLLRKSAKRQTQQDVLLTTLALFVIEPHVLSWLYVNLSLAQDPILGEQLKTKATFYMPAALESKHNIAALIMAFSRMGPTHLSQCQNFINYSCNPLTADNQLVFAATHANDAYLTQLSFQHLLKKIKSVHVKNWLKSAITEGKLSLNSDQHLDESEQMQCAQLFCLLLSSNKVHRFAVAQHLGLPLSSPIPNITKINLHDIGFPNILTHAMIQGISHHADTIEKIALKEAMLNDDLVEMLSLALKHKRQVRVLDVSANPITSKGAAYIGSLISHNHAIQELNLSQCADGDQSAVAIAHALPHSRLKSLKLRNMQDSHIRLTGANALATALQNSDCTLEMLDLSVNEINNLGANKIIDNAMRKPDPTLRTLCLDHNNISNSRLAEIQEILEVNVQERETIQRLAALDISKTRIPRIDSMRRCASQAVLSDYEFAPVLQFSGTPKTRSSQTCVSVDPIRRRNRSPLSRSQS